MKRWMIVELRKQDRQRFHVRRDPLERERRTHSLSHITEPSTGVPESHMVCTSGRANATVASTHPCITEPHSPAAPSASSASAIRRSTEPPCSITAKKNPTSSRPYRNSLQTPRTFSGTPLYFHQPFFQVFLKHLVPCWASPRAWPTQGADLVWPGVPPLSARCLRKIRREEKILTSQRPSARVLPLPQQKRADRSDCPPGRLPSSSTVRSTAASAHHHPHRKHIS